MAKDLEDVARHRLGVKVLKDGALAGSSQLSALLAVEQQFFERECQSGRVERPDESSTARGMQ